MVTGKDYPPNWVVMPDSSLTAELVNRQWAKKPVIEIIGNRQGIFSLGNLLLWISFHSPDTESLSITGLPFVHAKSALSLTVVQSDDYSDKYSKLVRMDKDQQFEWLIKDDILQRQGLCLIDIAFTPHGFCGDHFHVYVGPDSEYELFFARNDLRREFFPVD